MSRYTFILGALLYLVCGAWAARADVITDWNSLATVVLEEHDAYGTVASRQYAMLHLAMFDAVNGVTGTYHPYLVAEPAPPGTSPEAAGATAGYRVLHALYPDERPRLDALLAVSLATVPAGAGGPQGIAYGQKVADALLAARDNDGADREMTYISPQTPGSWTPTPPDFHFPKYPQWAHVTPFTMTSPSQLRPGPPPALNSEEYARRSMR